MNNTWMSSWSHIMARVGGGYLRQRIDCWTSVLCAERCERIIPQWTHNLTTPQISTESSLFGQLNSVWHDCRASTPKQKTAGNQLIWSTDQQKILRTWARNCLNTTSSHSRFPSMLSLSNILGNSRFTNTTSSTLLLSFMALALGSMLWSIV